MDGDIQNYDDIDEVFNETPIKIQPVLKRNIPILDMLQDASEHEYSDEHGANMWTERNYNTVEKWKNHTSRTIFIYDTILEKYKSRVGFIMVVSLILSSISTLLLAVSSSLLTINDTKYMMVAFWINIVVFIGAMLLTILQGLISITKWDSFIMSLIKYIEKLDVFYVNVANQLNIPPELRVDGNSFIKIASTEYQYVIAQTPDVFNSDLISANKKYEKFINSNKRNSFKHSQKYYESIV